MAPLFTRGHVDKAVRGDSINSSFLWRNCLQLPSCMMVTHWILCSQDLLLLLDQLSLGLHPVALGELGSRHSQQLVPDW